MKILAVQINIKPSNQYQYRKERCSCEQKLLTFKFYLYSGFSVTTYLEDMGLLTDQGMNESVPFPPLSTYSVILQLFSCKHQYIIVVPVSHQWVPYVHIIDLSSMSSFQGNGVVPDTLQLVYKKPQKLSKTTKYSISNIRPFDSCVSFDPCNHRLWAKSGQNFDLNCYNVKLKLCQQGSYDKMLS